MKNKTPTPEGTIGAAVILPSIYGIGFENGKVTNDDHVPDMEEVTMRLHAKKMLCEFFHERNMDVPDMIASLIPIVLEIAIEHCLASRYDEAMEELDLLIKYYMEGVRSDTIRQLVKQIMSSKKNNLDWS